MNSKSELLRRIAKRLSGREQEVLTVMAEIQNAAEQERNRFEIEELAVIAGAVMQRPKPESILESIGFGSEGRCEH